MNRVRILAVVLAAIMLLPILPIPMADAQQQERVSFRPDVPYTAIKSETHLYLQKIVRPSSVAGSGGTNAVQEDVIWTYPPVRDDTVRQEPYAVAGGVATTGRETAVFTLRDPLRHDVRVTGAGAFSVEFFASGPANMEYDVRVVEFPSEKPVANKTLTPDTASSSGIQRVAGTLYLDQPGRTHLFAKDQRIQVRITGRAALDTGDTPVGSWTLVYGNAQYPSRVIVVAEDAIKVAAWTEDADSRVQSVFRYDRNPNARNWVRGFFLMKSAFGHQDFNDPPSTGTPTTGGFDEPRRPDVRASLYYKGEPVSFSRVENEAMQVSLVRDSEFSATDEGTVLYRFSPSYEQIVYAEPGYQRPPGAYELRFESTFRKDDSQRQTPNTLRATAHFAIATAGVSLVPYPATPVESTSHQVAPGSSSTFVLLARNQAEVWDNLTLDLRAVPGALPGWSATLAGPGLKTGNRVELPPNSDSILTVTVQTPVSATSGTSATYQIRGRSTIDPNQETPPLPLLVTVVPFEQTGPGAGVIVPSGENRVRAGSTLTTPVFLWNRGSRATDLVMELDVNDALGWANQSLVHGGVASRKVTVEQVPPGAIVEVGVRASAVRASDPAVDHVVEVNASYVGLQSPPTAPIRFTQDLSAGFLLRLLKGFGGASTHVVEMQRESPAGNDPRSRSFDKDALDGTWYRLWVTNIGAGDDTYTVRASSFSEFPNDFNFTAVPGDLRQAWGEREDLRCAERSGAGCPPMVGYRMQNGDFVAGETDKLANVDVPAGRTKELYVWLRHERNHDQFPISSYTFNVVVESQGAGGRQVISGSAQGWDACTASQPSQVQPGRLYTCTPFGYEALPGIEAVVRDPEYDTNRLVDITNAERRAVTGRIGPGEWALYKFRATNAASFGRFITANEIEIPSHMNISVKHDKEAGWRVLLRFAGQGQGEPATWGPANNYGGSWDETLDLFNTAPRDALDTNGRPVYPFEYKWREWGPSEIGTNTRSQSFFDREIEMLVLPPGPESNKRIFAGESHVVTLEGRIRHPVEGFQTDSLTVTTLVAHLPRIELRTPIPDDRDGRRVYPLAGGEAALGLFVLNNGSAVTNVTLSTRVTSQGGAGTGVWTASPADTSFVLTPHENRTMAIRVRAPQNVPPGTQADFEVTATWRDRQDDPFAPLRTATFSFSAEVAQTRAVQLTHNPGVINAEPRQTINFTITVRNDGLSRTSYRLDTLLVPNWSASLQPVIVRDVPPNGGETRASFVMRVPGDVVSGRGHEFVVRAREVDRDDNLINEAYTILPVNIVGGQPVPSLQINQAHQIIERGGTVRFEMGVRNLGNVEGRFPIALIGPGDVGWRATVTDSQNRSIDAITIPANARRTINLTITAPVDVPERRVQEVELQVLTPDRTGSDRVVVRTAIKDYGLDIQSLPAHADMIPGLQAVYNMRVFNLGNDNDTFNLTLDMGLVDGLQGWNYEYGQLRVRVPPGEFRDVRLTVRSPKEPLPTPRTMQMFGYAGSLGAANLSLINPAAGERFAQLDSVRLQLNVLDYRVGDVDGDGHLELTVDRNKDPRDGFEHFVEIHTTGTRSQVVESVRDTVTGRTRFLIDVPQGGVYDGSPNVFWDPDAGLITRIQYVADVNFDAAPDYFLDLSGDTFVDRVWDSAGRKYLSVELRDILGRGEQRRQILVYWDADRFPDAFFDPEKEEVWRIIPVPSIGPNVVGFIPKDKTKPTLYYDIAAQRVYQSPLIDSVEFFKQYWYAGLLFLAAAVVLGMGVKRRRTLER